MTADFSPRTLEKYLVAQYAYWAGDFSFAEQCYEDAVGGDISKAAQDDQGQRDDSMIENIRKPDDILRFVAERRKHRIAERRTAFDALVKTLPDDASALESEPLILKSRRLRGAVWRLGAREFAMRAYVSAVKHSDHVLNRAKQLAARQGMQERRGTALGEPKKEFYTTEIYEWEEFGNPILSIAVSQLLFIEVGVFWTEKELPVSFAPVQKRLQAVLDSLSQ